MKFLKLVIIACYSILFLVSCDPESNEPTRYASKGTYDSGTLVLFEGNAANSGVSYLSFDFNSNENDVFHNVNSTDLGAFAQSMYFNDDLAYIVVSASNKIEITNRYSLIKLQTITNELNNPRYLSISNGKIYVTNQGDFIDLSDDFVAVYNQNSLAFIKKIPVPNGAAEKIVSYNNKIYVAQGGAYGIGNIIVVIDATTDMISNSIAVGESPNSLEINNGFLWVLCGGNSNYPAASTESSAKLVKIDLSNYNVSTMINFQYATTGDSPFKIYPNNMVLYGDSFYFTIKNGVYKVKVTDGVYSYSGLFQTTAQNLLGFGIKADKVYIGDAKDYIQNGIVYIYSLGNSSEPGNVGVLQKTINIGGIAPNGFYFNL